MATDLRDPKPSQPTLVRGGPSYHLARGLGLEPPTLPREAPSLIPFLIGSLVVSLIMSAVLLWAGLGLLRMRNWGRVASIGWLRNSRSR